MKCSVTSVGRVCNPKTHAICPFNESDISFVVDILIKLFRTDDKITDPTGMPVTVWQTIRRNDIQTYEKNLQPKQRLAEELGVGRVKQCQYLVGFNWVGSQNCLI